jgi:LPS-assembly protein
VPATAGGPVEVSARELRAVTGGVSEFIGDVELHRDGQSLSAGHLRHNKATGMAEARGDVQLNDGANFNFLTQETQLNLETRTGFAGPSEFRLGDGFARGDAERIDFEGPDITRLTRSRYTSCAPGQDDWYLKIRELELDTKEDIGTAYHASVNFQGVPVCYLPYFSFPISDERKSGFLIPRLGHSGNRGTEISAPYYLNLAPQFDDTFTPEYMSSRGLQLQNEFRYLTPRSRGTLQFEALQNDKLANGDDRAAGTYQHLHAFDPLWSGKVDFRGVSDKKYVEDFSDDLGVTSQTHLPQNVELDYRGPQWNFSAHLADYQTIDRTIAPADRPYARLPQLNLSLNLPASPNRLIYSFESELVSFERDASVNGERLNLKPAVSLPLSNGYAFLTPRIGLHHIGYRLSGASDNTPTLTRGVFSLDSGLFFERDSRWSEHLFTQTLEPRLYYLYIPGKNQDSLPNFDSSIPDFSFPNLFRDNRFVGGDRIGDANQITAAVTTHFIDDQDGTERASASLGRIYYLDDRQVNLPAATSSTSASDIVAEVTATLASHWHARSNGQWNRETDHTQKYSYYLQYNPAKDRIVNLGRRVSRGELEQTDVSTEWPLATRWTLRARSLRSQVSSRNLETYAGVEYNACCWALRVMGKRRLFIDTANNDAATQHFSIMVELELTGLSKLGRVPDSPLSESMFSFPAQAPATP